MLTRMEGAGLDARGKLLDAALQLWADHGWCAVTLPAACAAAGLDGADAAELAEEFAEPADLLCEVFDESTDERASAVLVALQDAGDGESRWQAAMAAFVQVLEADPRHAVVLVEAIGSPELRARRRSSYRGFASVVASQSVRSSADPRDVRSAAHFCLGGLTELTLAWMDPATDVDRETLLVQGARLFELCLGGG